jgi:hypothetical protein
MTDLPQGWREVGFAGAFSSLPVGNKKMKVRECLDIGLFPVVDQGDKLIAGYTNDDE